MILNSDVIKDLWCKTYNTKGKPDWSHLFPYYDENILFQDTIQRIEGKALFMEMCNRLADRCKELVMDITDVSQTGNIIFFQWTMTMMFGKYPSSSIYGCTKLTIGRNGLICEQRDYYDLWGDIFDNIPHFGKIYRKFVRKKFG